MSERGIEFFNNWVRENVNAEGYPQDPSDAQVTALVENCTADAVTAGVSIDEIEEDMGDLRDAIFDAMEEANTDEVNRLAAKDD